eukprot:1138164-Pelagomonas_calceolata.AAC.9
MCACAALMHSHCSKEKKKKELGRQRKPVYVHCRTEQCHIYWILTQCAYAVCQPIERVRPASSPLQQGATGILVASDVAKNATTSLCEVLHFGQVSIRYVKAVLLVPRATA